MDIVERLKMHKNLSFQLTWKERLEIADEVVRLREALERIAKHDLQAIALDALSPNVRKALEGKE